MINYVIFNNLYTYYSFKIVQKIAEYIMFYVHIYIDKIHL